MGKIIKIVFLGLGSILMLAVLANVIFNNIPNYQNTDKTIDNFFTSIITDDGKLSNYLGDSVINVNVDKSVDVFKLKSVRTVDINNQDGTKVTITVEDGTKLLYLFKFDENSQIVDVTEIK